MTRRQIHAYALAALLAFLVAVGVALAMLGHATMSGGPQWSAGAIGGLLAVGLVTLFVTTIVGATFVGEEVERYRSRATRRTAQ